MQSPAYLHWVSTRGGNAGTNYSVMCEIRILSQKGKVVISHCPLCGMLNIWHQNLLLAFTSEQFNAFKNFIDELDFEERSYPFPDGEERAILRTPNQDINFAFTVDEFTDFHVAMEEALYMLEVYYLINK